MQIIKREIRTERLTLKAYSYSDKDFLVELLRNKEISMTFMIPDYKTIKEYRELADKLILFSQYDDIKHLEYGIYLNDILIGFINDCGYDDNTIEIGYVIDPQYKNRGYCTEAVKAILQYLKELGFKKVIAGYFIENVASKRVMEKCGMHHIDREDEEEYRGIIHKCNYCEIVLI